MKLEPMADQIVGRIVRAAAHKSGIVMPDSDRTKGESVFVKVDRVGPDVRRAKPGQIIVHRVCEHVWLRNGVHFVLVSDADVRAVVEEIDLSLFEIEGEPKAARAV